MEKTIEMYPEGRIRTMWPAKEAAESIIRSAKSALSRQRPAALGASFAITFVSSAMGLAWPSLIAGVAFMLTLYPYTLQPTQEGGEL